MSTCTYKLPDHLDELQIFNRNIFDTFFKLPKIFILLYNNPLLVCNYDGTRSVSKFIINRLNNKIEILLLQNHLDRLHNLIDPTNITKVIQVSFPLLSVNF